MEGLNGNVLKFKTKTKKCCDHRHEDVDMGQVYSSISVAVTIAPTYAAIRQPCSIWIKVGHFCGLWAGKHACSLTRVLSFHCHVHMHVLNNLIRYNYMWILTWVDIFISGELVCKC